MKEKLQKIIDNHCKQFGESLHFSSEKKIVWQSKMRTLGCYFHSLYLGVGEKLPTNLKCGKLIFLNDPSRKDYLLLVPNDIALKILNLGYLP